MTSIAKTVVVFFAFACIATGCASSGANVYIFSAKPPVPYKVLGLVNGAGPNRPSAMQAMMDNAYRVGANGVIVSGEKTLGSQLVVQGEAILYQGQLPPPAQPVQ